ncbi:MAG: hypothetical protein M3401_11075 [Actinomycetota bacterium]|nr:hypothetical protein [Actinomycetota bacterium]
MAGTARLAEVDRTARRLISINAQRKALELALEPFDPDFDSNAWAETFESLNPGDLNKINTVVAAYDSVVMNLTEVIKTGTRLAGLWSKGQPRVESALQVVVTDGGLTRKQADLIERLFVMRGRVSHASPDVRADELREHVIELQTSIMALSTSVLGWLRRHDINFIGA